MLSNAERLVAIVALAIVLASPALGQEAPTEDAPAAAAPVDEDPAADPPSPEPAAPAEEPEAGAGRAPAGPGGLARPELLEVVRETFGDWDVRCAPDGEDCFMYQLLLEGESNPVAEISLIRLPEESEAAALVTVVTPLETLLPVGLMLQIDDGEQRQYPYSWCGQVGCFARFGFSDDSLNAMKRGRAATVSLAAVVAPERPINLEVSLSGFTAAFDSLEPPTAAAPAPAEPAAPRRSAPLAVPD